MSSDRNSEVELIGFAIGECTVKVHEAAAKYLGTVHRTALELSIQNRFGTNIGGFWLLDTEIEQLRKLPLYYPTHEAPLVQLAVEAYLAGQLADFHS
jgi:hypothetical protein